MCSRIARPWHLQYTGAPTPLTHKLSSLLHHLSAGITHYAGLARIRGTKLESNFHELSPPTRLAQTDPEMAISVFSDMLPKAKGETVKTLREYRGRAYLNTGRNKEAAADFSAARQIEYTRQLTNLEATALWRSGDCKEAIRLLSAVTPLTDHEERETRGVAYFASGDLERCEADLAPVVALFPGDGRTASIHHLAACLIGKPELSQLTRSMAASESWGDKRFAASLPRFWAGKLSEEQLLERARHPSAESDESVAENEALAYFAASQSARLTGDTAKEIADLERVVAIGQYALTEHWLARARISSLRGTKPSSP